MLLKKLSYKATIPTKGSEYSAGYDLYSIEDVFIQPGETVKVRTGIAMEIPHSYFGALYSRSGLAVNEGLRVATGTSVIDEDYRGEVIVPIHNDSKYEKVIKCGDRIAQLVLTPYLSDVIEVTEELSDTDRGDGGFGSTGKN